MTGDPNPSAPERVILDRLRRSGSDWVTVGQLRTWLRKGLPRTLDQVVYFAALIEKLGPRHTDHALLVVAGAWPEYANASKAASAFTAWFARQFGAIADDPDGRYERLYYRMSRAGGARRRASQLPRLGTIIARDLKAAGHDVDDEELWTIDLHGPRRFETREYLHRWASRLPHAREALGCASDADRLDALRLGYLRAAAEGRPADAPLHALDVLLGQEARRPMTDAESVELLAKLHVVAPRAIGA